MYSLHKQLLHHSYENKLSHIPSALSMLDYVDVLFSCGCVTKDDKIVIGKPFGAQAYYLVWQRNGMIDDIGKLSIGVKHDEIEFVTYSEETIGNALGVAIGIALTTPKRVWVNITDASLQMGNVLEAIQFIGHHQISNIFVTIDYNNAQVTGATDDILSVEPIKNLMYNYGWFVQEVNGHNQKQLQMVFDNLHPQRPNVVFCNTVKGGRIQTMSQDIKTWHYKKIETSTELQSLVAELQVTQQHSI